MNSNQCLSLQGCERKPRLGRKHSIDTCKMQKVLMVIPAIPRTQNQLPLCDMHLIVRADFDTCQLFAVEIDYWANQQVVHSRDSEECMSRRSRISPGISAR